MAKDSIHVVPNVEGQWSVRKSGAAKAARVFDSKEAALGYARSRDGELVIHGRDGRVMSITPGRLMKEQVPEPRSKRKK